MGRRALRQDGTVRQAPCADVSHGNRRSTKGTEDYNNFEGARRTVLSAEPP